YSETITINKPNLVIKSESGNPEDTIIMANKENSNVFYSGLNGVTISGFNIRSGGYIGVTGIRLSKNGNCNINNNDLSYNDIGISLSDSNNNEISDNRIHSNVQDGIHLVRSEKNTILNNIIYFNNHGIVLENSSSNSMTGNQVYSNKGLGFYLMNSNDNNLKINIATRNDRGIYLRASNSSTILSNVVSENNNYGILISYSNFNIVSRNIANNTSRGIHFDSASSSTVTGNIVASNNVSGFFMCRGCHKNLFYNNYANNTINADVNNTDTTWSLDKIEGRNIVGGPYLGGSFWGSPNGKGFSETAPDVDEDGIADNPFTWLNENRTNVTDYLPLVPVSNPRLPVLPVANFITNVTSGPAPLAVQFTDLSQNSLSRSWDIDSNGIPDYTRGSFTHLYTVPGNYTVTLTAINENGISSKTQQITVKVQGNDKTLPVADFASSTLNGYAPLFVQFTDLSLKATSRSWDFGNDGTSDSGDANPTYTYTIPGIYTVNLKASNSNGNSSKTAIITVLEASSSDGGNSDGSSGGSSSSSSSGGSGGGGGGGSPEPQNNVEIKELSQTFIGSGQNTKFDFTQKVTAVESITFDSKKTVGKTTTIVEMLKNQSTLVSGAPSDEVYKYLNIWVGNGGYATEKNIENAAITFKVSKSWVQGNKIDKSSITLNRYDEKKWNKLSTTLSGEDDNYLKFTAKTPGFSPFAITGKSTATRIIQPGAGDKSQPATVSQTQNNSGNGSTANANKTAEQKESPGSTAKPGTSLPDFEAVIGVAGLVAVFLYRRKEK
ncbi:MAG: hypothetical protein QG646_1229, partial [Euryarchaeota archaeon]|nr:hypothetical protein [Euryarchaeota archaeon]